MMDCLIRLRGSEGRQLGLGDLLAGKRVDVYRVELDQCRQVRLRQIQTGR
jgi:hypothetical protein